MSTAVLQVMRRTAPHMRPTVGSVRPAAAISTTLTTKADEIGLLSVRPVEMPFTIAKTKHSPTTKTRYFAGWLRTRLPLRTTAIAQNATQSTSLRVLTRFQSGGSSTGEAD